MDWSDLLMKCHTQTFSHDGQLSSLPEEWQRELAAICRLEMDMHNGAYLQFLTNWGRDNYLYASQALKKMGAVKTAEIIDRCQAIVDDHVSAKAMQSQSLWRKLMPNRVIGRDGKTIKEAGSDLPDEVLDRIYKLSYEYMAHPERLDELGSKFYQRYIDGR